MATLKEMTFTVRQAAERFGKHPSRIRQICIEYEIGTLIGDQIRLLTAKEMARIGEIIEKTGRNRTE